MSLLLPQGEYALRRRREVLDESRTPVASYPDDPDWTGDGYDNQRPDRTYAIALDAASWPVGYDDLVTFPDGTEVLVRTAVRNPEDPDPVWDAVRGVDVTAVLRRLAHTDRQEQG